MAVILNNKKSTYGSPYCFYTLEYTNTANRTADKVDITFKITSHLQYGNSSLGSGYTLKGQLYINGAWSSDITLKASSDSWSGTTPHTKTQTLTITSLSSTDTTLSGIKFKVTSNASDKASGLNSTSCSDITIPIGHTPPDVVNGMWFEDETSPVYDIYNNIDRKTIVENLSIKRFIVAYNLSDNATISSVGIYNNIYPYSATTYEDEGTQVEYTIDFSNINLVKSANDNTKIPITTYITDSFGATNTDANYWGTGQELVSYIPYKPPTIIESDIIVKRARQITGNATISLNGTYYKSTDVLNQSGNIKVYYKYWENKENPVIPSTYTQIPTSSVAINNDGTFSVSNYSIGSNFNIDKSYRVLVKVQDNYRTYELSEPKSIPVGEALWTEYKDRVDFKKLTIKGNEIFYKNIITANATSNQTLSTTNWTLIPITQISSVGDKLELVNNGIKIKSGVSKIMVNANIVFSTGGTSATRRGAGIYLNSNRIVYCHNTASATYTGASISPRMVEVQENDVIYLYAVNQGGSGSVLSSNDTYITVEVIE